MEKSYNQLYYQQPVIELKNLLASFLLRWKAILLCVLFAASIACGLALLRGSGNELVSDEDVVAIRSAVASDKAADVDLLFKQYVAYQRLQRQLQTYYVQYLSNNLDLSSFIQLNTQYLITSNIDNLINILGSFTLKESDYDALRTIAPDELSGGSIYQRISIFGVSGSNITVTNFPADEVVPRNYLLTVSLLGNSKSQCEKMQRIVAAAIQREIDSLMIIDPDLTLIQTGQNYNYNTIDRINAIQKSNLDALSSSEVEMTKLATKISKLSSDQKAYYDLLIKQFEQDYQPASKVSLLKNIVIGALIGAMVAIGYYCFKYLMDGKLKTLSELECLFQTCTLQRISFHGKWNLFGKWAASLMGADLTDSAKKTELLAADLSILIKKSGGTKLYLLCADEDHQASTLANDVRRLIAERDNTLKMSIGNPVTSATEMECLSDADGTVVFAELRSSKYNSLVKWQEICSRYHIPVYGAVATETCW